MRIVIDGFFFQLERSGISRLWTELLEVWGELSPDVDFIFLNREQNDINIPRINITPFPKLQIEKCYKDWTLRSWYEDKEDLNSFCIERKADLFISTYYTHVDVVPNIMVVYDLIPENNPDRFSPSEPIWEMKRLVVNAAHSYICISYNTARQLAYHYKTESKYTIVAHSGVNILPEYESVNASDEKEDIPFILVPGLASPDSYKNQLHIFKSLRHLIADERIRIIVTGRNAQETIKQFEPFCNSPMVSACYLNNAELEWHYRNCLAVVYPSREEGFGLPIVEALARGSLAVTCMNSSLVEVGSTYAVYVDEDDPNDLLDVITYLLEYNRVSRHQFGPAILENYASRFCWSHMARRLDALSRQIILEKQCSQWMQINGDGSL